LLIFSSILATRQLHPLRETLARRPDAHRWRRSFKPLNLGPCQSNTTHQSRIDIRRSSLLRLSHLARLQSVFLMLQRRQHCRVGSEQQHARATVPRTHRRSFVHRHQPGWFAIVDGWSGQHREVVGSSRRTTTATARLQLADLLARLLSDW
jgi:hypothetical protein